MQVGTTMLRRLMAFCVLAFVAFAVAGFVDSSDRGSLHASATAFLVGAALAFATRRALAEQAWRLESAERRLAALESDRPADTGPAAD